MFEKIGPEIVLRGVADGIRVPSDEAEKIVIRPLGDGDELKKIAAERGKFVEGFLGELLGNEGVAIRPDENPKKAAYFAHLDQPVVLPSGRKVRFADVLASALYLDLQRRAGPDDRDSSDP